MSVHTMQDAITPRMSTLALHDALPICPLRPGDRHRGRGGARRDRVRAEAERRAHAGIRHLGSDLRCARARRDRKSTRLNSSHLVSSYAVFCLKKNTTLKVKDCTRPLTT